MLCVGVRYIMSLLEYITLDSYKCRSKLLRSKYLGFDFRTKSVITIPFQSEMLQFVMQLNFNILTLF